LSSCLLIMFFLLSLCLFIFFFFFQAEDGIRDRNVTGVQTCALPISFCKARMACPISLGAAKGFDKNTVSPAGSNKRIKKSSPSLKVTQRGCFLAAGFSSAGTA